MTIFQKKLNKKGFTLAELLIVIAILAILVAIAIPIFTGQLKKARIARDEANVRSAKGQCITYLLSDDGYDVLYDADGKMKDSWTFDVSFKANGDLDEINPTSTSEKDAVEYASEGALTYGKGDSYALEITSTEVTPGAGESDPTPGGDG